MSTMSSAKSRKSKATPTPKNYLSKIKELQGPNMHIKNKHQVNAIIETLVKGGKNNLQVITDFDETVTKSFLPNGDQQVSTGDILVRQPIFSKESQDAYENEYRKFHRNFQLKYELDENVRYKAADDFRDYQVKYFKGAVLTPEFIRKMTEVNLFQYKNGADTLFNRLNRQGIPVTILSAGWATQIKIDLHLHRLLLPNMRILGNTIKFTDCYVFDGYVPPFITAINKDVVPKEEFSLFRKNLIILGDNYDDAKMGAGIPGVEAVLKIGYLSHRLKHDLPYYEKKFDVVLLEDESVDVFSAILNIILQ